MHTHCYSMLYSCGVFGTVWHWLTRFNMRVPNMPLATCSYCCCPAKGVPWLIVLFSARHCDEIMLQVAWSCFSTGLIAWRWWLLQHGTTTVRKTSQLFKIGKSKKVLPFRVLVQIHEKSATHTHTHCVWKVDREYHGWLPNPLFQDLFQDLPSPNVCLWRSTVLLGFVLDWMPSRQPCWVGGRDRESADSHDEKSGVCYGLLQT